MLYGSFRELQMSNIAGSFEWFRWCTVCV